MALTIYWSKRADKKFDEIIGFLNDEWGETVTITFVRKVYYFLEILLLNFVDNRMNPRKRKF